MRILIAAVLNRAQFAQSTSTTVIVAKHLSGLAEVSAIYLVVRRPHQLFFERTLEECDHKLEILSVPMVPGTLGCHLWYRRYLPKVAARLRADLIHLSCPMPVALDAFYPPTAFSFPHASPARPATASGMLQAFLAAWGQRNCSEIMKRTAWVSEPLCRTLGLMQAAPEAGAQMTDTLGRQGQRTAPTTA